MMVVEVDSSLVDEINTENKPNFEECMITC
jgi:hypothetical protein